MSEAVVSGLLQSRAIELFNDRLDAVSALISAAVLGWIVAAAVKHAILSPGRTAGLFSATVERERIAHDQLDDLKPVFERLDTFPQILVSSHGCCTSQRSRQVS